MVNHVCLGGRVNEEPALKGLGDCAVIRLFIALGEWKCFFFLDNKEAEQDEVGRVEKELKGNLSLSSSSI